MRQSFLILFISFSSYFFGTAQVKSPLEFMPHAYGQEFTPHHRLVDYYQHVADESPLVVLAEYGLTNQKRPLIYSIITSENNHTQLEKIRKNNLINAGLLSGTASPELNKSIVWLSFGVHGNEAGASESAMQAIYELVSSTSSEVATWLRETIVIIDPCINPDGYNRYTHWNINTTASHRNISSVDNERNEPWPSGRVNHFYHDLNRDWAWASQKETKHRLDIYHQWLPHVHADFHEMFPESPYFFAPAAEPFHKYISDFQRNFQITIGKNHARHFDENNWLYYTKEEFDLFYPSYGDTYPSFNGAIGMTYEQAGHGVAGRAILLNNGDTLTLQDRIDHHTTTALSTIEAAANNREVLTAAFKQYFHKSRTNPLGQYAYFIFRNDRSPELQDFLKLMDLHHIEYQMASESASVSGYVYKNFNDGKFDVHKNDIIISAAQSHGIMAQVLLEPKSTLADSVTYDLTAWSLPMAFGLDAVATNKSIRTAAYETTQRSSAPVETGYAYAIPFSSHSLGSTLSALMKQGVRYRTAQKSFKNSNQKFPKGSIVITHADNKNLDLVNILTAVSQTYDIRINTLSTGFSEFGPDIGSDKMSLISPSKILLIGGPGVDQYNYGQIWNYLENEVGLPYTTMKERNFSTNALDDFNTLILPEGYYPNLSEHRIGELKKWVQQGGKLIVFGSALNAISGEKGFPFQIKKVEKEPEEKMNGDHKLERFESAFRKNVSNWMPGAIVQLQIDDSHPLGYGLGKTYATLKLSSQAIPYQDDTWNVGYIKDDLRYTGFIGNNVKPKLKNSTTFFVKDMGRGQVVGLLDNPLYRSFWHKGKQVFFNALFMVQ